MKHRIPALCILLLGAAFAAAPAYATDSVVVNGITVTCSNSCVVSSSGGTTTVRDCCGGRVNFTIRRIEE